MASLDGMTSNRRGPGEDPDVVLGEDWEKERDQDDELTSSRSKRGFWTFRRSPLTRKIVTFNLIALNILIIGVLYLNSSRESLIGQRADALVADAMMVSTIVSVSETSAALSASRSLDGALQKVPMEPRQTLYVFDTAMNIVALREDVSSNLRTNSETKKEPFTPISDGLDAIWTALERILPGLTPVTPSRQGREAHVRSAIAQALKGSSQHSTYRPSPAMTEVSAVAPVERNGQIIGAVALIGAAGEIDQYVKAEREGVFHLLIIGTVVSIVLSLVLASTISNPLNDLATAAELGRDKSSTSLSPARIRIPDLSARPDEIGRLSGALRGMVSALYDRIDANEQFAADVAHEIKNPLASLRSAVGTLRFVKTDEQREKLLDVIDHDVRRLDRLVSNISNASRLDSELVKETQQPFD